MFWTSYFPTDSSIFLARNRLGANITRWKSKILLLKLKWMTSESSLLPSLFAWLMKFCCFIPSRNSTYTSYLILSSYSRLDILWGAFVVIFYLSIPSKALLNTTISTWKQCRFCKSNQWSHHCLGILRILSSSLCLVKEIRRDNGNMSTEIYCNVFALCHSKECLNIPQMWNFQWTLSGGNSARPNVSTRQVCCVRSWVLWVLTALKGHTFPQNLNWLHVYDVESGILRNMDNQGPGSYSFLLVLLPHTLPLKTVMLTVNGEMGQPMVPSAFSPSLHISQPKGREY